MSREVLVLCAIISLFSGIYGSKFTKVTGVDEKWHKSEDGSLFYIESEEKFNWYDAWNECARKNMTLIAIDTYRKHLQIDDLIKKVFAICPSLWIGGHDNAIDMRYEWPLTGEVFSFTNWGPIEPDRVNNSEHCILIWTSTSKWHDLPCAHKLGFICEENRYIKELENLKKQCQDKSNGMARFKNAIMHFNLSPKFEYSYEKATDLDT